MLHKMYYMSNIELISSFTTNLKGYIFFTSRYVLKKIKKKFGIFPSCLDHERDRTKFGMR